MTRPQTPSTIPAHIASSIATEFDKADKALSLAKFRLTCAAKDWHGFKVWAVDTVPADDEMSRIIVYADYFPTARQMESFDFLVRRDGSHSGRIRALFNAAGLTDADETYLSLEGRYFAARDRGRSAEDFGPLLNAFVSTAAAVAA